MPRTRNEVAADVVEAFAEAERAAEACAAASARCVAVLVEARTRARLSPLTGAEVLALMARGTQSALDARHQILSAHPLLADLGRELRVTDYGPSEDCVPNEPFIGASSALRVVGAAA